MSNLLLLGNVRTGFGGGISREPELSDVRADAGGGWDTWLTSLIHVLTALRGASDKLMPLTGTAIPLLTGVDTMSVIALLTPHVALACQRLTGLSGPVPADRLGEDHKISNDAVSIAAAEATIKSTSWVTYLAATPDPSDGAIRGGNSPGGLTLIGGKVADPYDIANAISLVRYWQACVDQSVSAIHACGANGVGAQTQPENMASFMAAVQHLTTQLDLVKQDAASSSSDIVNQSLSAAKTAFSGLADDAANLAGEIAAKAANKAGELAGGVAKGFFSQIGTIGYAVVAIIIYMAFYR